MRSLLADILLYGYEVEFIQGYRKAGRNAFTTIRYIDVRKSAEIRARLIHITERKISLTNSQFVFKNACFLIISLTTYFFLCTKQLALSKLGVLCEMVTLFTFKKCKKFYSKWIDDDQ